jgi:phosphohistidine phosphatase
MLRTLALLRHGLSAGQSPDAALLPEGAAYLRRLGAKLAAEHWQPAAIFTSPYVRARESAAVLASALGCEAPHVTLRALVPEGEPADALAAIAAAAPDAASVLVVSHMPLVGRLAQELVGEDLAFSPGTFVEIAREGEANARLVRRIGPRDMAGA